MKDEMQKVKELSEEIFAFISNPARCNENLEIGRIEFGNGCYAMVSEYTTVPREEKEFESHIDYYDVQMLLRGEEVIEVTPVEGLEVTKPYVKEKDITFFSNKKIGENVVMSVMKPFVIGPETAHMPGVVSGAPQKVKKIVFKTPVR